MTESLGALRVDLEGRLLSLGAGARRILGACTGGSCAELVGASDNRGAAICRPGCARAIAAERVPRREATDALIRGRAMRLVCERLGDELVVIIAERQVSAGVDQVLTARERAVLSLVAEGLTDRAVAARLGIQPSTARTHVEHARDKLGARTRAQAVARARAAGQLA